MEMRVEEVSKSMLRVSQPQSRVISPSDTPARRKTREQIMITVSIGVAEKNHRHSTPDQVVLAADKALYRAKEAGRTRVSA